MLPGDKENGGCVSVLQSLMVYLWREVGSVTDHHIERVHRLHLKVLRVYVCVCV